MELESSVAPDHYKNHFERILPSWRHSANRLYHPHVRTTTSKRRLVTKGSSNDTLISSEASYSDGDESTSDPLSTRKLLKRGKRSEEITSELDISRRIDLDLNPTLEKWWVAQATPMTKRIVLYLVILGIVTLFYFISTIFWLSEQDLNISPYLCESPACNLVASDILSKINPNQDPCSDFFLFTCGQLWERSKIEAEAQTIPDDDWVLRRGQIHYEFAESGTIGNMLRARDPFFLQFHQACMDIKTRNNLKLQPYFDVLRIFGLDNAEIDCNNNSLLLCFLSGPMADLFGRNLLVRKLFSIEINFSEQKYRIGINKESTLPSILSFGVEAELSVVMGTLNYLAQEGTLSTNYHTTWGDVSKMEAYATLFICAELNLFPYYDHGQVGPIVWNRFSDADRMTAMCKFHTPTGSVRDNSGNVLGSTFLWGDFVQDGALYQRLTPRFTQIEDRLFPFDLYLDQWIGDFFPSFLNIWAPQRGSFQRQMDSNESLLLDGLLGNYELTVRFLQWRILHEYGHVLDERLDRIGWPTSRNILECNWISSCLWTLFLDFGIYTQLLFLAQISDENIEAMTKLFAHLEPVIERMLRNFTFSKLVRHAMDREEERVELTKEAFGSFTLVWPRIKIFDSGNLSTTDRLRLFSYSRNPIFFRTVADLRLLGAAHVTGTIVGFFSDNDWEETREIKRTNINRPVIEPCKPRQPIPEIVMPLGTYEPPYFGTNFPALDLGGVGKYALSRYVNFVVADGMYHALRAQNTSEQFCASETIFGVIANISDYSDALVAKVTEFAKANPDLWRLPNSTEYFDELDKDVNSLYSDQLSAQLALKLSYEIHEELIRQSPILGKMILPGLEQYNARQLLFMQTAARECEAYSINKFTHMKKYGPVPPPVEVNLLAANSKEFASTFRCNLGTRMNPVQKFNFYE